MLFNSILHGSSCLGDVEFTAVTGNPVNYAVLFSLFFFFFFWKKTLFALWITTAISPAFKPARCTVMKCLRRGLVFYPGESNGCCCRRFLVFQVSRKIRTMILLDALTFFLIFWLNPSYVSEYLHLPFLLTRLTFLPQSPWQSLDLHSPSTEPYHSGILLP